MPIEISPNPDTVPGGSTTPQLQNWYFAPASINIDYFQGTALPDPVSVMTVFKDIAGTSQAAGYTDLTYRAYLTFNENQPQMVVMGGSLAHPQNVYTTYTNGLYAYLTYTFTNLAVLAPGTYIATANHEIWGKNSSGTNMLIELRKLIVQVNVYPSTMPVLSVNEFNFAWDTGIAEPLFSPEFTINASSWVLISPLGFYFTEVEGTTLVQPAAWGGAQISGSGLKTLQLVMMPTAEPDEILENPITLQLEVNGGILNIPIHITFIEGSGFYTEKSSLEFTAYKGVEDAEAQTVVVYYPQEYTITVPAWMTLNPTTGSGTKTLVFEPISANNMDQGTYQGVATIVRTSDSAFLASISLTYNVITNILSPYPQGQYAFTLDRLFLEFLNTTPEAYFDVQVNARIYDFYAQTFTDESLNFKVPLFQGRQQLNVGQAVHRLMKGMADLSVYSAFLYRPAIINMVIIQNAGEVTEVFNYGPINFIAGLSPQLSQGSGFLDINPGARRVTPSSWQIVNMIIGSGALMRVYRNGEMLSSLMTFNKLYSYKLDFGLLGASPGDVFELRIEKPESHASIIKYFKVFPEGYNSNTIVWENEYKLRSVLECTGKYQVNSEFENRSQELELQLRKVLDKLESTKTAKLTLNTGWLLKTDAPSVESLMRAKRAVLLLENKKIALVPTSTKITNINDDQALISFDLEFQINSDYDEEIYLF